MYGKFFKRFFDVMFSLLILVFFGIFMIIIAAAVKLDSKGPVIFKQKRIGKNGKVFTIYKFRTMCVGAESQGSGVYSDKGDKRVTRVGKILRATSLDELPQIFNILKGEMSFIGPRPPLTYHPWSYSEYTEEQKEMFSVRPGITGLAQINGRKNVEWNKRIEINLYYIHNMSFLTDVKIALKTVLKVMNNSDNENKTATVVKEDKSDRIPKEEREEVNVNVT